MVDAPISYVFVTEQGGMRIVDTRVSLDSVVIAFNRGESPEVIRAHYPALTLEQVYGAIAYYLAHRQEVDVYLVRQQERWQALRDKCDANPPPVVQRLRAMKAAASRPGTPS